MGAIYLATALLAPHGCPLRNLTLVNCDLGPTPEGSKALAVALLSNDTLESLNISDNMIGVVGADYLAESLRVNKTLKNLIARNCGLPHTAQTALQAILLNKPPLDWLAKKNLASTAVEMRDWMLKIAQQNNFKFANQHVLEQEMDARQKELDRENALQQEIESTTNKFKKGALKIIKKNVHQHVLEHSLSTSKSAPSLPFSLPPNANTNAATTTTSSASKKHFDDYDEGALNTLNTQPTTDLTAAATRDLLLSCKNLHSFSLSCADECSAEITRLSTEIGATKSKIKSSELAHSASVVSLKDAMKVQQADVREREVPSKKLRKDLKLLEADLASSSEPLEAAKLLLADLESKKDRTFTKIEKPERGMTMGEAIRDARARTNARGSVMPQTTPPPPDARSVDTSADSSEPEIMKAARQRLEVMTQMTLNLRSETAALKQTLSGYASLDDACRNAIASSKKLLQDANEQVFKVNQATQLTYSDSTKSVLSLQIKMRHCRFTHQSMSARIDELQRAARDKQKKEDWTSLVKETCFNKQVDDQLRDAIYDELQVKRALFISLLCSRLYLFVADTLSLAQADTLLEEKNSLFNEIDANWKYVSSTVEMLEFNLRNLTVKVDESNRKLGNDLQHWERERNAVAGVGLTAKWKVAKTEYDKLKTKKDRIIYGEPPEGLVREFERAKGGFEALDEEKTMAEETLRECKPLRIKWDGELKTMTSERDAFSPVYETALKELNEAREDHAHKSILLATLHHDHMALVKAEELLKNPPKSFSSKADKEGKEALVNFAKQFNDEINSASKVVTYHVTMRKVADMSRMRKEQLLLQAKEENQLTKEQFLMKMLRELVGIDHDLEHGTAEWRWALNNLRRKKHVREQKARSVARKADRDRRRRENLVFRAESLPLGTLMKELKEFGMIIDNIDNEDRLVELHVMCSLRQRIIETGNWGRRSHVNNGLLGDGVYFDPKSPIKHKVKKMKGLSEWLAQDKLQVRRAKRTGRCG